MQHFEVKASEGHTRLSTSNNFFLYQAAEDVDLGMEGERFQTENIMPLLLLRILFGLVQSHEIPKRMSCITEFKETNYLF